MAQLIKLLALSMIWCWSLRTTDHQCAVADPQTLLLDTGCSANNVKATNLPIFLANINQVFCDLRSQVSDQGKHFATAQQAIGDIVAYAMFQCRDYLSQADCLACFDTASAQIRNVCSTANGARVIYDGCFLRYESEGFFNQITAQGNGVLCGNQIASDNNAFSAAGLLQVLTDLQTEITTNRGFFASTKTQVGGGVIHAIAQCAETITVSGCLDCLNVGFNNIQSCLPNTDGRAFDSGYFIRYSDISFCDDEQDTSNSNPKEKSSIPSIIKIVLGILAVLAGGAGVVKIYIKIVKVDKKSSNAEKVAANAQKEAADAKKEAAKARELCEACLSCKGQPRPCKMPSGCGCNR